MNNFQINIDFTLKFPHAAVLNDKWTFLKGKIWQFLKTKTTSINLKLLTQIELCNEGKHIII